MPLSKGPGNDDPEVKPEEDYFDKYLWSQKASPSDDVQYDPELQKVLQDLYSRQMSEHVELIGQHLDDFEQLKDYQQVQDPQLRQELEEAYPEDTVAERMMRPRPPFMNALRRTRTLHP